MFQRVGVAGPSGLVTSSKATFLISCLLPDKKHVRSVCRDSRMVPRSRPTRSRGGGELLLAGAMHHGFRQPELLCGGNVFGRLKSCAEPSMDKQIGSLASVMVVARWRLRDLSQV
jgi:hypothetical protein